nr:LamG-like jellyroll fold domain-containing protein [Bifidobacterium sp. DSM 109957]
MATLVAPFAGTALASEVSVPTPLVSYSFDVVSDGVVSNLGSGGSSFDGAVSGNVSSGVFSQDESTHNGSGTLQLDGTEAKVAVPNGLYRNVTEGITVSAWVKWDGEVSSDAATVSQPIWYIGGDDTSVFPRNTDGLFLTPDTAATSHVSKNKQVKAESDTLPLGEWKHVAVTQSTDMLTLYVDGVQVAQTNDNVDFSLLHSESSTFSALIGMGNWKKYSSPFKGEIDEFKVWQTPLDGTQVKALYDGYFAPVEVTAVSASPVTVKAEEGSDPTLPASVAVVYSDSSIKQVEVAWNLAAVDWDATEVGDTIDVEGALAGIETFTAKATVIVTAKPSSDQIVVSTVARNGTKGYLEVDGQPFPIMGVQTFGEWQTYGNQLTQGADLPTTWDERLEGLDRDWLENVFEKAAATGIKTLQIELAWRQIQPSKEGEYDWSLIDRYVEWAKKYDLKLDWTWFGSIGCGGAVIYGNYRGYIATMPDYLSGEEYYAHKLDKATSEYVVQAVSDDKRWVPLMPFGNKAYPEYTADELDRLGSYLYEQEQAAVHAMFNHLAEVDTTHQSILFQVYNEPDSYPYATSSSGNALPALLQTANALGKAVKTADYVVATRMNFKRGTWIANAGKLASIAQFAKLPYIDFVGPDTYDSNPSNQAEFARQAAEISDIAYLPETGGNHNEKVAALASVLAAGGFMNFWHLNDSWATEFTKSGGVRSGYSLYGDSTTVENFQSYTTWTLGVIPDMPESTERFRNFMGGFNALSQLVAKSESSNMAAFNAEKQSIDVERTQTETVGDIAVTFSTTTQDVGLAIYDPTDGGVYVFSDTFGSVIFNAGEGKVIELGSLNADGVWVKSSDSVEVSENGDVTVPSGKAVRIADEASSVPSQPDDGSDGEDSGEGDSTPGGGSDGEDSGVGDSTPGGDSGEGDSTPGVGDSGQTGGDASAANGDSETSGLVNTGSAVAMAVVCAVVLLSAGVLVSVYRRRS